MTSSWNLPGTVTLTVALYIPSLHVLATVDTNWKHIVGCANRYIIDSFLCTNFAVRCLGDLFANEGVMMYRLDKLFRARLGEPSEACSEDNGTAVVQAVVVDLVVLDVLGARDVVAVLTISDLRPTWLC